MECAPSDNFKANAFPRYALRWAGFSAAVLLWASVSLGGMASLWSYAGTPGKGATSHEHEKRSAIAVQPAVWMFLHPQCPCSRASVAGLAEILARHPDHSDTVTIVFADVTEDVYASPLYRLASSLPSVRLLIDRGDVIAARMDVHTSGQMLVYDATGSLVFSGGLTAARGHEGPSGGVRAVSEIFAGREPAIRSTPVFGCELR